MKRNIFFLIGMMLCFTTVYAQNKETVDPQKVNDDLVKDIKALSKEVMDKDKTIEKLNAQLEKLKTENEQLDSVLQAERREGKAATNKKQIKQLREDSLAFSQKMTTTMEKVQKKHQEQMRTLIGQHKGDSLLIASLQKELDGLKEFRVTWLAQLAESVDEKWLNKPYTVVDIRALDKDYEQYEQYAPMDAKVAEARNKLKPFVEDVHLYQRGIEAVNSAYDAGKVDSLIAPMRTLYDGMMDGGNRKEVANLFWQLDNYAVTIKIFQEVIEAVNKAVKGQSMQTGAWPLAKATLEKQEKDSKYISAIRMIPWLEKQYDEYFKLLEKDSTKSNKVGEAIMSITLP